MVIRLLLIFSLLAQLSVSFRCCGIAIVRPDVLCAACPDDVTFDGSLIAGVGCRPQQDASSSRCCGEQASASNEAEGACCPIEPVESASSCCGSAAGMPCGDGDCEPVGCAGVMDPKKQGPDATVIDLPVLVAHPLIGLRTDLVMNLARHEPRIGPAWPSARQRRAALAIWII